ncbi:MAG: outer membrane beta-barrel protein [Ginsengibacter sp.]
MKIVILLCLIWILPPSLFAQKNMGELKGVIYDSLNNYALQSASVSVFKRADSSIVDFQLSNTSGEFDIKNLPVKVPLYMVITYTGYRALIKNVVLDSLNKLHDFRKLFLYPRAENEMDEVVINKVQPIRMNGDTLEINPDAFKLDSNAVVEDMLMRVPGLTVWGDGTITMNGRALEKVYVDGKPFFGGAAQTATQNLPKNAIEKIQVYQEKDLSKIQASEEKPDSIFAMNIKLKEDKKKGRFGKVGAGYGTDERYSGDGVIQFYNKRTQSGIAIGINNINKEDGTGEKAFMANTFKSNFANFFGGNDGSSNGITRRIYANAKVQHSFSESDNSQFYNRLSGDYGYLNTSRNVLTNTTNIQNIGDYKLSNLTNNRSVNNDNSNTIKLIYENRKQYGNFVNLSVNYTNQYSSNNNVLGTDVFRNDSTSVSKTLNSSSSTSSTDNLNVFGFIRSNDYGQLQDPRKNYLLFFNGGYSSSLNNSNTVSRFSSDIDTIPPDLINRRYNNVNKNYYASMTFNYDGFKNLLFGIYNFFNIDVSLANEISISRNEMNANVADLDTVTNKFGQNKLLTNQNILTDFQYRPGLNFRKSINKSVWEKHNYWLSFEVGLKYMFQNQKNESSFLFRNIDRTLNTFTPAFNMDFNYNKNNAYRINSYLRANVGQTLPDIDQLYPLVDSTNRYNIIAGNPDLKSSNVKESSWNLNINRAKMNTKSSYSAGIYLNYNNTSNAVSDNTVYDSSGRSVRYLVNVDHQNTFSGNGSIRFSTKLNKLNSLSFSYTSSLSSNIRPGFINYVSATSKNNSVSNTLTATYSLTDKFNITVGETIANNRSEQKGKNIITSVIRNYSTTGNINYFITKKINFNTSLDYQNNKAANGNSIKANIWNANAIYRFMQQKAELKFSAFDLLRQNKNIENFVMENSATTTITNGLQQYFMITFSFYPRKFGSKNGPPPPPGL